MAFFSCGILKKTHKKMPFSGNTVNKSVADTTKKAVVSKLKPYDQVITKKAISFSGLFMVHKVEEKYFFEIPDSLLETDLLVVNRIAKGAAGTSKAKTGYGGDQINENLVRFSKGPNHKLFIRTVSFTERAVDSTANGMYRSILNSSIQPIVAAFEIKALSKDSSATLVDVTDYLNGDNDILFFASNAKTGMKLGGIQADKSYINYVWAYPGSIEIRTTKTYTKTATLSPFGGTMGGGNATFEMNSSIIRLPKRPMAPRLYDDRVGYFATGYIDFDRNPQGVAQTSMITRWRLEPKKEDEARYLSRELVEPKQQIVFYIDPATPKKWVPYLIHGVNDWNVAFEAAGFKNAIVAKEAPSNTQDSTWSMESARHSVIVYKPSAIANASGPHVHDPRTGEILETHVNWYHNVMSLLRNWYFIQASAVDPKARKMKFDDELMGQLIRFVSSHEVGHTLGLRHNFGSSSTVPVEKLRDKAWVEANGHTPSIMDYARFNYVAQPEDGISEKGIFPRIGDYDKWAIEWGYRWWPELSREEEETKLNQWIITRTTNNKRLWFGHESDAYDPRSQNEDLGDDAMLAGTYGVKNLKRIVPRLLEWTMEKNEGYDNLKMMYKETINQFARYTGHVLKNISGVMTTPKSVEQKGSIYSGVTKQKQKDAVEWLQQQIFKTPFWLLEKEVLAKTGDDPVNLVASLQNNALTIMMSSATVNRLVNAELQFPVNSYNPVSYLADVERGIWSELTGASSINLYRRNLQRNYVSQLLKLAGFGAQASAMPSGVPQAFSITSGDSESESTSIGKAQLRQLQSKIKIAIPKMKDRVSRYHLQDCLDQINRALIIK